MTPILRTLRVAGVALIGLPVALAGCGLAGAEGVDDEERSSTSVSELTRAERLPRYERLRAAASRYGVVRGAYLLAGIATTETNLAHCWVEAQWACRGPASPDCGGGPVIAGASDGPCGIQQGGLGLFQFDAGTFGDTLRVYGNDVLTLEGQTRHAVAFVTAMVRASAYTTNAGTLDEARAWIDAFDPANPVLRDQWVKTVLRHYNGCQEGWSCWAPRYRTYSEGLAQVLADTGGAGFWNAGSRCDGAPGSTTGAIDTRFRELGGCGSVVGRPTSDELATPDGRGRYTVFERGSIYWTEDTGAHEVHGRLRDAWAARGWEAGPLGYPTRGEEDVALASGRTGRRSTFEHGALVWDPDTDRVEEDR